MTNVVHRKRDSITGCKTKLSLSFSQLPSRVVLSQNALVIIRHRANLDHK